MHTYTIAEGRDLLFMDPSRNYQFPPNYNYILLNNNFDAEVMLEVVCISRSGNPFITAEDPTVSEYTCTLRCILAPCVHEDKVCVEQTRLMVDSCFRLVGPHQHPLHVHIHLRSYM